MSATRLQKNSHPPHSVSSDLGQLAAIRHLISGEDCATAGAATDAATAPTPPAPAVLMNLRLVTCVMSRPPGAVCPEPCPELCPELRPKLQPVRLALRREPTRAEHASLRRLPHWMHADYSRASRTCDRRPCVGARGRCRLRRLSAPGEVC